MKHVILTLSAVCVLLSGSFVVGDGWDNWRGVGQQGVAPEGEYPIAWDQETNILWKSALPGAGGSTPIVTNGLIVLTSPDSGKNAVLCLDQQGTVLWNTKLGDERPGKHRNGTGSNPSPVTDGKLVYAYFKSGDLAALDLEGKIVWQKNLQEVYGEDTLWWDLGTSPVLTDNHVVVACVQSDDSYIAAFDKATGDEAWKQSRNLPAPEEANQSYSTPVVVRSGGNETLVVLGADHVTAHDATDGQELWRVGGLNPKQDKYFRSISSPVVVNDIVVAPYARGTTLTAIRMGGKGDVTSSHIVWTKENLSSDVPTPAAMGAHAIVCTDKGELAGIDAATGEVAWMKELERHRNKYYSSPVVANGLIYVTREDGKTFVVKPGKDGEVVGTNDLKEHTVATPVFVDGKILIRTDEHLYCIGE